MIVYISIVYLSQLLLVIIIIFKNIYSKLKNYLLIKTDS